MIEENKIGLKTYDWIIDFNIDQCHILVCAVYHHMITSLSIEAV